MAHQRPAGNPHETWTFCTCREKNRDLTAIFAVLRLRSVYAFAIVSCGPGFFLVFPRKIGVFWLGAGLDMFEGKRQIRRISRLNGSQATEQDEDRFTHGREV